MTHTVLITCEGACNPNLNYIDALARRSLKEDTEPAGTEYLWSLQRRLVHTPHAVTGCCEARCTACGARRRYGAAFR